MTLHLGTWLIPFAITIAALLIANREDRKISRNAFGYGKAGAAAVGIIAYLLAITISLAAWLAWSVIR